MKTPGEAAKELRWIAPSAASLTILAKLPLASAWPLLRTDPGVVLLYARTMDAGPTDVALLEAILHQQADFEHGFTDWSQPVSANVRGVCCQQALMASQLAEKLGIDAPRAWLAGFLAPLGQLALQAAHDESGDPLDIARRLCRAWRLPTWLAALIGNLGLHVTVVERLGADRKLFQIVQLAVLTIQEQGAGLGLIVGAKSPELRADLHLSEDVVTEMAHSTIKADLPGATWQSPAKTPLLVDLLEMALQQRRRNDAAWIERLERDLDRMQAALVQQCADEQQRLQAMKLSALAEFAAGAGHEINNPLAVISGQAQYALKQLDWLDVPAEEIEDLGAYLEHLRGKVAPSLNKILGQTKRVHSILTEIMHFARPHTPQLQTLSARSLVMEVANNARPLADQRKVRILTPEIEHDEYLNADAAHARTALAALIRNGIEAAPTDGWVSVRVTKRDKMLELMVEDSGAGPCPSIREHLFDPFFSGRSAGRGRGMGLPTAWRLARQQGGDVRFDGLHDGVPRFVLTLPLATAPSYGNGPHAETKIRHVAHLHEAHR